MSLWNKLQGVFCIYKPPNISLAKVARTIKLNLTEGLNNAFVPNKEKLVTIQGNLESNLEVKVTNKLAVHPLSLGNIFIKNEIHICFTNILDDTTSGVCLVGVNAGVRKAKMIRHSQLIRVYRLSGLLGKASDSLHITGKIWEKSRFLHVKQNHLERVLMGIQATHQKRSMDYIGHNLSAQELYESLSEEGIVRPGFMSMPLAYKLKVLEFNPPDFTIEMACINENEHFMRKLIHDVGLLLKTNAVAYKIRCIRYGPFTVDDALLRKEWIAEQIVDNIDSLTDRVLDIRPKSSNLSILDSHRNENSNSSNLGSSSPKEKTEEQFDKDAIR